jgi:hypothetical protein
MTEHARQRELGDPSTAAFGEHAAERRQTPKTQVSRGSTDVSDRAHPLEFDENGFPVVQRTRSFFARVAELRSP